jgi:hypothetical protein
MHPLPQLRRRGWCLAIKDGRTYALELKAPSRRLSESQRATHSAMTKAGVQVAVADNLDDALRLLEAWGLLRGTMT